MRYNTARLKSCVGALINPPAWVWWCARGRGFSCAQPISDRSFCMANFKNRLARTKKWLPLCPLLAAPPNTAINAASYSILQCSDPLDYLPNKSL